MGYRNKMDLHVHTDNSLDACHSVMLMTEYAIRNGMRAVAITDHCECDKYKVEKYDRSIRQSYFDARKAKSVFSGKITVIAGIEIGQPLQNLTALEDAMTANEYDFIIGSLHNIAGKPDFSKTDFTEIEDPRPMLDQYFKEVMDIAKWNGFDTLAHINFPFRYINGVFNKNIDESLYDDQIEEILKVVVNNGKALEINTSGLRQNYNNTFPTLKTVRRFKELGGEYITIGSDAHVCKDTGSGIEAGMEIAKAAGFNYVTLYQNRQALPITIE